jgi:hypothetical protein
VSVPDSMESVGSVLRRMFPDLELLKPSGYLADCPLHRPTDRCFLLFDETGRLLGCTSGECSREDVYAARRRWKAAA